MDYSVIGRDPAKFRTECVFLGVHLLFSVLPHCGVGGRAFKKFWKDEGGAVGTEYALLLVANCIGVILALLALGAGISTGFTKFADTLSQSGCDNRGMGTGYGGGAGGGEGQGGGSGEGNTC